MGERFPQGVVLGVFARGAYDVRGLCCGQISALCILQTRALTMSDAERPLRRLPPMAHCPSVDGQNAPNGFIWTAPMPSHSRTDVGIGRILAGRVESPGDVPSIDSQAPATLEAGDVGGSTVNTLVTGPPCLPYSGDQRPTEVAAPQFSAPPPSKPPPPYIPRELISLLLPKAERCSRAVDWRGSSSIPETTEGRRNHVAVPFVQADQGTS
jgi:hypothetical protein